MEDFLIHNTILATAAEYNLPILWIIFNSSAYGTVWGLQRQYFDNRSMFTEFKYNDGKIYAQNYTKVAESYKVKGIRVEKAEDINKH